MDSINFNCQYTGIECIYTSTRNKSTIIDDWYIGDSINDYTPPYINTITIENGNRLSILFSEALRKESISRLHFSIDGIFVDSAYRDEKNFALVHITNITMLSEGLHYIFSSNLTDEAANNLMGVNSPFRFKRAHYGDIIVSEFMADPSPTITLPETEYIELFNNSEDSINLTNFYLGDSSSLNRIGNHSWIHIC
jgi:hypothetical protein